jgi:hypothetical protein
METAIQLRLTAKMNWPAIGMMVFGAGFIGWGLCWFYVGQRVEKAEREKARKRETDVFD